MEPVDVLAIIDGFDNLLLRDVLRERQLHYEAVDLVVGIEAVDGLEQFLLGDVVLIANESGFEATLFACEHFVLNIGFATSVVANQYGSQVRTAFALSKHLLHFGSNLLLDVGCYFLSVD